ncbi:unnamed protein product [Mycena citricolor]|uniref:Alginate lyase domain-containing protein n=1 Tax=Mycena citricolor TaxID=2018698 RepID=A0AAD2Q727_9AGAR|nr:unnamed protein product [Mycena citricolor]
MSGITPFRCAYAYLSLLITLLAEITRVRSSAAFTQYANDFVDPKFATGHYGAALAGSQQTIMAWADEMDSYSPWSVTFKPVTAPSGNKHDYMSWAPYQWPDCSSVKNSTVLTPQQVWKTCPYVFRDGLVNPDRTTINDFQSFFNLSDGVLYSALAHTFQNQSSSRYSRNIAKYIDAWFLNNSTFMNPNLNYAQMLRGPRGQHGEYTGILDLRGFAKIASGILILRNSKSADWTPAMDRQFVSWCGNYINWLQTAPTAKIAAAAKNNHGTFYANQLSALKLIVNDIAGATTVGRAYFGGVYKTQIASNGDQPLEGTRTRPYHYRNFNIAGMITNARLLKYADPTSNCWNTTAQGGATIQSAVNFLMTTNPNATNENNVTAELYPNIAAVASVYGDPTGKYVGFLKSTGFPYTDDADFLWDQPLAVSSSSSSNSGSKTAPSGMSGSLPNEAAVLYSKPVLALLSAVLIVLLL